MWPDLRSESSPLARNLLKLVCSAADHSHIDIKVWFASFNDSYTLRLLHYLHLMHTYHHVTVNFVLGRNWYYTSHAAPPWHSIQRRLRGWARLYSCYNGCVSPADHSVSHSKWVLVSHLREGGSAAMTTSSNIGHEQLAGTVESALFYARNQPMYNVLSRRTALYMRCGVGRACGHDVASNGFRRVGNDRIYFAPNTVDPVAAQLRRTSCTRGGRIEVGSLWLRRPGLLETLVGLEQQGCTVTSVVQIPTSAATSDGTHPRCMVQHDKFVVVRTPSTHYVIAGSEDFGRKALHRNDNVMVLTHLQAVVNAYQHEYWWMRAHSHSCS